MVGTRPSSANTDDPSGLGPLPSKGGKGTVPVCWGCILIRQMVWGSLKFAAWERESLSVGLRSGNSEVRPKVTVCWMDLALGFAVGALLSGKRLTWEGAEVLEDGASLGPVGTLRAASPTVKGSHLLAPQITSQHGNCSCLPHRNCSEDGFTSYL